MQAALKRLGLGDGTYVDVRDTVGKWLEAVVLRTNGDQMYVHYLQWVCMSFAPSPSHSSQRLIFGAHSVFCLVAKSQGSEWDEWYANVTGFIMLC